MSTTDSTNPQQVSGDERLTQIRKAAERRPSPYGVRATKAIRFLLSLLDAEPEEQ